MIYRLTTTGTPSTFFIEYNKDSDLMLFTAKDSAEMRSWMQSIQTAPMTERLSGNMFKLPSATTDSGQLFNSTNF